MCLCTIYVFQGSVHLFSCNRIGRPIMGLYKSLTDTWMWKLGLRPHNSFSGNIVLNFRYCVFAMLYLIVLLILRIGVDRQPSALLTTQQRVGGVPVQHVDTPTTRPLDQQHHDAQKQPFIDACKACRHGGTHGTWLGHDLCMAKGQWLSYVHGFHIRSLFFHWGSTQP